MPHTRGKPGRNFSSVKLYDAQEEEASQAISLRPIYFWNAQTYLFGYSSLRQQATVDGKILFARPKNSEACWFLSGAHVSDFWNSGKLLVKSVRGKL
jgi:hypothetical protein